MTPPQMKITPVMRKKSMNILTTLKEKVLVRKATSLKEMKMLLVKKKEGMDLKVRMLEPPMNNRRMKVEPKRVQLSQTLQLYQICLLKSLVKSVQR